MSIEKTLSDIIESNAKLVQEVERLIVENRDLRTQDHFNFRTNPTRGDLKANILEIQEIIKKAVEDNSGAFEDPRLSVLIDNPKEQFIRETIELTFPNITWVISDRTVFTSESVPVFALGEKVFLKGGWFQDFGDVSPVSSTSIPELSYFGFATLSIIEPNVIPNFQGKNTLILDNYDASKRRR